MFKFLSDVLTPIQNCNGFSFFDSLSFSHQMSNISIQEDETMVSFDVISLLIFTAIPVYNARHYIRKKLIEDHFLHLRTKLDIDDVISLLNFVLSNNYFFYKDIVYKQVHRCAMGTSCDNNSKHLYGRNRRNGY